MNRHHKIGAASEEMKGALLRSADNTSVTETEIRDGDKRKRLITRKSLRNAIDLKREELGRDAEGLQNASRMPPAAGTLHLPPKSTYILYKPQL